MRPQPNYLALAADLARAQQQPKTMKTTITTAIINLTLEMAKDILLSASPVQSYRDYLSGAHNIDPESITDFDVKNLRKQVAQELGEIELNKLVPHVQPT